MAPPDCGEPNPRPLPPLPLLLHLRGRGVHLRVIPHGFLRPRGPRTDPGGRGQGHVGLLRGTGNY